MPHPLRQLALDYHAGKRGGIPSICSAHPVVIAAALELFRDRNTPALIEATCNQVNQDGGYTGMRPADFRRFVEAIADKAGLPKACLILGGDHLGPNPWKHLPSADAMEKAAAMIAAYAAAGFTKLHLDTSMACADDPVPLPHEVIADRAARLAAVAETHFAGGQEPVYVIGTEVPVPGGATEKIDSLELTDPAAVARTHALHRDAFARHGQSEAFERVIALVVQPGVEFGDEDIVAFEPDKAQPLSAALDALPGLVFEAHSTDYQSADGLRALVERGFAILKVGPWLTFALREGLYALDAVADVLDGHPPRGGLMAAMEDVMRAAPDNWRKYYRGTDADLWLKRHFSYSDRIRYYWPDPRATDAVDTLRRRLQGKNIPAPVLHQYLPQVAEIDAAKTIDDVLAAAVRRIVQLYAEACGPAATSAAVR